MKASTSVFESSIHSDRWRCFQISSQLCRCWFHVCSAMTGGNISLPNINPALGQHLVCLLQSGVGLYHFICITVCPVNTRCWTNGGLMLGQRRRRWPNIKPALVQRLVFDVWLLALGYPLQPGCPVSTWCNDGQLTSMNNKWSTLAVPWQTCRQKHRDRRHHQHNNRWTLTWLRHFPMFISKYLLILGRRYPSSLCCYLALDCPGNHKVSSVLPTCQP